MTAPNPPQVIPRPPDWVPGAPAPWDGLPATARRGIAIDRVRDALERVGQAGPVPDGLGLTHVLQAPELVAVVERAAVERINSGVLAALFEEEGEARLIFTRRSADLRLHTGEVSFPGGRIDPGETPSAAALREAHEEIGLDPGFVTTVGWLHPVLARRSLSLIMPVVATLSERPRLLPNEREVARVFDVSLAELAEPSTFHEERWLIPEVLGEHTAGGGLPIWFFEVADEMIWGATARMIYELLRVVLTGD
jgi:8-oxo-dGTP pyrophosphatase MutT (NUDIX family)